MSGSRRAFAHYVFSIAIMSIYGAQVCPFVDSLSPLQQVLPLIVLLSVQYMVRGPVLAKVVGGADDLSRTRRTLIAEFGLFLTSGVILTVFNAVVHDFPLESGLKLIVGLAALGFFAAIDLTLETELDLAKRLKETGRRLSLHGALFPVSRKVSLFASIASLLVMAVYILLVNKDLEWLKHVEGTVTLAQAQRSILTEFGFVTLVLVGAVLNVIRSYSRNLRWFLDEQTHVMEETTKGRLDGWVPISTNDEFGAIADYTNAMVAGLKERTEALVRTQDVTINALASLAETRDNETGAHILRTQRYVRALAEHLRHHPKFATELTDDNIDLLFKSAPLHDIGKVGIPDRILLKPGKHTDEEFAIMKTHAFLGSEALERAEAELGSSSFLRYAREIALTHHEKWDGSGYPQGLKAEEIPMAGRLMAVADVYDALISKRVYKPAFPHEKAVAIIVEGRGTHFDPDMVDAMLAVEDTFLDIKARYGDEEHGVSPEHKAEEAAHA